MKRIIFFFLGIVAMAEANVYLTGCAQIVSPTGGPRDSLPPKLMNANPKPGTVNFKGNRITLDFDEYIHIDELQQNLLVSPTPKINPNIDYKLRTVTIKLRDTLEPNTTYTIDLGNSIKDINENNAVKDFRYVFSTGPFLDSLEFSGKVEVAQTGKTDSTLIVMLYKNLSDSAVQKLKPKYIARLDHDGKFSFSNLSAGLYKVYALKDDNGSRTYDSKAEMFAFADSSINISGNNNDIELFAYVEQAEKPTARNAAVNDKKLRYVSKLAEGQDILRPATIEFNKPLKNFDKQKILLTDTLNKVYPAIVSIDSTNKKISIQNNWVENSDYKIIISKDVGADSTGVALVKSDTIRFKTKKETDYGSIKLHFVNFTKAKNAVLEFLVNNEVVNSYPLTSADWSAKLFIPGEYELRILDDENKNGKWDPGNFDKKIQPEKAVSISKKINIKANWDNETDIEL